MGIKNEIIGARDEFIVLIKKNCSVPGIRSFGTGYGTRAYNGFSRKKVFHWDTFPARKKNESR